jgi:hypothetical protein
MTLHEQLEALNAKQQALHSLQAEVDRMQLDIARQLLVSDDHRALLQFLGMLTPGHPLRAILILADQ